MRLAPQVHVNYSCGMRPMTAYEFADALKALTDAQDAADRLGALRASQALQEVLEQAAREDVTDLRAIGLTWREIGASYGVSAQACQQRYGRRARAQRGR